MVEPVRGIITLGGGKAGPGGTGGMARASQLDIDNRQCGCMSHRVTVLLCTSGSHSWSCRGTTLTVSFIAKLTP